MYTRPSARPLVSPLRRWFSNQISCRAIATSTAQRVDLPYTQARADSQPSREQHSSTTWIRIYDVPKTALHNDVRRAVARAGVTQKFDVYLDYYRFLRSGSAWLEFDNPHDMHAAAGRIAYRNRFQISAYEVRAAPATKPLRFERLRGIRGRAKAAQKGLVDGNGPDAGTMSKGKDVVLYGLPGKIEPADVMAALKGFGISQGREPQAGTSGEEETDDPYDEGRAQAVVKLAQGGRSLTSRHLVRLASTSEAHRLVRKLHMTYWDETIWGTRYMCRAHVVY